MNNKRLVIKNIGSIKYVDIELNKINVFIGMQGSGKSTIAKIISYVTWVEKHIALNNNIEYFTKENSFYDHLVTFHKLDGYFHDGEHNSYDSLISYESDIISILYSSTSGVSIKLKDVSNYKKVKISYIPAERNIVSCIPNWFDVKLSDNNIRSFMSDWEQARKKRSLSSPMSLMNGRVKYHYEEPNRDVVVFDNNIELDMTNTASGFQSMIPMFAVVDYCTKDVYTEDVKSIRDKNNISSFVSNYLKTKIPEFVSLEDSFVKHILNDPEYSKYLTEALDYLRELDKVQLSKLIIEEPEQNLFPETQRDVTYQLLGLTNDDRVSLTLTTHSPYVLYAINNCIVGGLVKDNIPSEISDKLPSKPYWVDPKSVSIWQITDEGGIVSIQNEKMNTVSKQYLNDSMNDVMNEYFSMLKYVKIDG
ncbi:MAG: AAA family ATPase [Rikenellaceae bacterium]